MLSHLSDVKFSSRASGTDDEMFGEEETLSLAFLLQRQRTQSASRYLPLFAHWHLDQRTCGVTNNSNAYKRLSLRQVKDVQTNICFFLNITITNT